MGHDAWAPRGVLKDGRRRNARLRGEGVGLYLQALAAAAKEEQPDTHDAPHCSRAAPDARVCITMRDHQYAGVGEQKGQKVRHPTRRHSAHTTPSPSEGPLSRYFTNHGCGW
ncbi:hypothetical protein STRTUCAR8_03832 [Streptomyces turgidiscabies Car8]|uniref:Uncharacterized protein n=1 Tax=Streptomyces turgidiscabies (strain Car8) TaxID=698760 RepID=L7FC11_STRT8|nr:hypothetical protein STRTUCAR8_03832 [Streptomyces turgidiscabies Car8]